MRARPRFGSWRSSVQMAPVLSCGPSLFWGLDRLISKKSNDGLGCSSKKLRILDRKFLKCLPRCLSVSLPSDLCLSIYRSLWVSVCLFRCLSLRLSWFVSVGGIWRYVCIFLSVSVSLLAGQNKRLVTRPGPTHATYPVTRGM